MKVTQIEKLNQLISRTDMTGNQKVEWLTNFIDEHVTEQFRLHGVVKSLKGVDKIPLIEWREKTFREIGANRFELRTNTALVYGMDEISKMYDSF